MTSSGGLVLGWADQSGNGNDATQADSTVAPLLKANVINGLPALNFGSNALSANQFLQISDAGTAFTTNSFTFLVEARFADFASYRTLVCKTGAGSAAQPLRLIGGLPQTRGCQRLYRERRRL